MAAEHTLTVTLPADVWERVQIAIQWESDPDLRRATAAIRAAFHKLDNPGTV